MNQIKKSQLRSQLLGIARKRVVKQFGISLSKVKEDVHYDKSIKDFIDGCFQEITVKGINKRFQDGVEGLPSSIKLTK